MALSIRKQSVETKARTLANLRGVTMTTAIEQALDNALARDEACIEEELRVARLIVREAQQAYAAAPVSGLTEQELMGWDENGLPT